MSKKGCTTTASPIFCPKEFSQTALCTFLGNLWFLVGVGNDGGGGGVEKVWERANTLSPAREGEPLRVGRWVTSRRGVTNKLRDCPLCWYMVCAVVYCCTTLPHPCIDRTRLDDNLVGRQTKGEGEPWRIGWLPTYCQRQHKSRGRGLTRIFSEHHQATLREEYLLNIIQPRSVLMLTKSERCIVTDPPLIMLSVIIVTLGWNDFLVEWRIIKEKRIPSAL